MKQIKRLLLAAMTFVTLSPTLLKADDVTVQLLYIDNESVKAKMEKTIASILTEANTAEAAGREMNYAKLGVASDVQNSLSMLWENSPFVTIDDAIIEKCVKTKGGYQVRNIGLLLKPLPEFRASVDDNEDYQEAVFSFDTKGNMTAFALAIDSHLYGQILRDGVDLKDHYRRELITDIVERFGTAYNQKDMAFLENIFSDDALIITGHVIKRKKGDIPLPDKVELTKQSKREYLTRLQRVFNNNKYIHVKFEGIKVEMHPMKDGIYGVTLHQSYTSDHYHDEGYLFMIWDFRNESHPQICVRSWQPDKYDDGTPIDPASILQLNDFDSETI